MGSSGLCSALSLYMLLKYSWRSFKLLKTQHPGALLSAEHLGATALPSNPGAKSASHVQTPEKLVLKGNDASNVRQREEERKAELVYLLQFWTIYSVLTLYEYYFEFVLALLPFYYSAKFILLLYLNFQQTKGVAVVFESIVRPYILRAERFVQSVVLPPLIVLPKAMESAILPCLSLYRVEITVEYLEQLLVKLQEERARRLTTIEFDAAAIRSLPNEPTATGSLDKHLIPKGVDSEVEILTQQERQALEPEDSRWRTFLPGIMNSVIGLTVQTKELFATKVTSIDPIASKQEMSVSNEKLSEEAQPKSLPKPSAQLKSKNETGPKDRFASSSDMSSEDSSGSSSDSSDSSSSEDVDGALGRYRMVAKSPAGRQSVGKYEQGFSSLGDYEEESPAKAGAVYMDSVIKMMKGVDSKGQQTKRVLTFEQ